MRKQGRSNTSEQRAPVSAPINMVIPLVIYVSPARSSRSHLLQQEMERGMELKATELRLGLPGSGAADANPPPAASKASKRSLDDSNPSGVTKAQVVGWPPVRTHRKNSIQAMKAEAAEEAAGQLVKVSMDGAPYLRKVDLKGYKGYKELREGLEELFKCFESSKKGSDQYAITYEDKDGDLMLVGDVPWEMFTCSCKKLRIMRGIDSVRGLASNQEQKTCKFI